MNDQDLVPLPLNNEKGKPVEHLVSFAQIDLVLIGMCVEKIVIPYGVKLHRYNALLVIRSDGAYFFKKLMTRTALHQWTSRFEGKVSVRYTDKDLRKACQAHPYTEIDFSSILGVEDDLVSPLLGRERYQSHLEVWTPEGMMEKLEQSYKKRTIPRTRKAEMVTLWVLFLYNFLFILLALPTTPVDAFGVIHLTDTILLGYVMANLLIPVALVFWRNFTLSALPLVFTLVALVSNTSAVYLALWVHDFPFVFSSIILLNTFNLVLWAVLLTSIKWCKVIVKFVRSWEFG